MTNLTPDDDHTICARCGKELRPLEQIYAALELAPGEAFGEGQARNAKEPYSFALGYLTQMVAESIRDLACHAGTCYEGMI